MLIAHGATDAFGEKRARLNGGKHFVGEGDFLTGPFVAVFNELEDSGADVVFSVEPGEGHVWVKRGFPEKTAVALEFHAEERVGKRGEVVIIDSRVEEGSARGEEGKGADVRFDILLCGPERKGGP